MKSLDIAGMAFPQAGCPMWQIINTHFLNTAHQWRHTYICVSDAVCDCKISDITELPSSNSSKKLLTQQYIAVHNIVNTTQFTIMRNSRLDSILSTTHWSRIHAMASMDPWRWITLSAAPRSGTTWLITRSIMPLVNIVLHTARQRPAMCRTAEDGCSR